MTLPCLRPLSLTLLIGLSAPVHAVPLAPQYAGTFLNGDGANSTWVQVADDWRGNTYGDEPWGTGIWSLADQAQVMGLPGDAGAVQSVFTQVSQIDFADQRFIDDWGATWGTPQLAPMFDNTPGEGQDNWASRFWGYISITTAGAYNFGVLFDDGFRFSLYGADGASQSILRDGLNPRDRQGFDENLWLTEGLYAYQLDAYERLEAGAVQLSWYTPGASDWALVPQSNLYTTPVPEPSIPVLMLAGLAAVGLSVRNRRS